MASTVHRTTVNLADLVLAQACLQPILPFPVTYARWIFLEFKEARRKSNTEHISVTISLI